METDRPPPPAGQDRQGGDSGAWRGGAAAESRRRAAGTAARSGGRQAAAGHAARPEPRRRAGRADAPDFDRTHAAYLHELYGVDIGDCELYHLVLDSTAVELDACVEMIVRAAGSLVASAPSADRSVNGPAP